MKTTLWILLVVACVAVLYWGVFSAMTSAMTSDEFKEYMQAPVASLKTGQLLFGIFFVAWLGAGIGSSKS